MKIHRTNKYGYEDGAVKPGEPIVLHIPIELSNGEGVTLHIMNYIKITILNIMDDGKIIFNMEEWSEFIEKEKIEEPNCKLIGFPTEINNN